MKLKLSIFFIFIFFSNISFAGIDNKIVLKVENQIITNYEIKNKILTYLVLNEQIINQVNIDSQKKQALEFLLIDKLKKIELSKYDFKDDNAQINKYLNSISSNNVDNLKTKFKNNSIDFNLFLDEIKIQFKWQKLIYRIYSNKIEIDENVIQEELDEFIKNKISIKEFDISEIEILLDNSTDEDQKILDTQNQIKNDGFEKTAAKISISTTASNGGNLGWVNSKSLSKEMFSIIDKMKIGDISKPIKKQNTILFLKLVDRKQSKTSDIDLPKLKKNLINLKKNELFSLYSNSHLSKLKNNSLIEYK